MLLVVRKEEKISLYRKKNWRKKIKLKKIFWLKKNGYKFIRLAEINLKLLKKINFLIK
jgi:hypothetical protein